MTHKNKITPATPVYHSTYEHIQRLSNVVTKLLS